MFQELKVVIGEQPPPDVDVSKFEEALGKFFAALETAMGNMQGKDEGTADLRQKLDVIHNEIKSLDVGGRPSTPPSTDPNHVGEAVLEKLETLRMDIKDREGVPEDIVAEIVKLREALDRLPSEEIRALGNVGKPQEPKTEEPASVLTVDLSEVHAKLDGFIESFKSQLEKEPVTPKAEIPEVRFLLLRCPDPVVLTFS
jgi:hypothetical protein